MCRDYFHTTAATSCRDHKGASKPILQLSSAHLRPVIFELGIRVYCRIIIYGASKTLVQRDYKTLNLTVNPKSQNPKPQTLNPQTPKP